MQLAAFTFWLERCNPWPHVANRTSISQLLSSRCYLFTVFNSGLLSVQRLRPASHAHFRHRHISVTDTCGLNSSIGFTARAISDSSSKWSRARIRRNVRPRSTPRRPDGYRGCLTGAASTPSSRGVAAAATGVYTVAAFCFVTSLPSKH